MKTATKIFYQFSFKYFEAKNIKQTAKSSNVYIQFTYILPDSDESCFLHSDQFLSLETANKNLSLGENAIWVTVRLWNDKLCSFFQELVLHKIIAACSFLEACIDGKNISEN